MTHERFSFALDHIQPDQWKLFEDLSSHFLFTEFPELRTTASPSGDGGRDAEIPLSLTDGSNIKIQYSIEKDWKGKIKRTLATIQKNAPDTIMVIFTFNQVIGALADTLKTEIRDTHKMLIDIRDKNWFLERRLSSVVNENAAERFIRFIADPYFEGIRDKSESRSPLDAHDLRNAFYYIGFELENAAGEKNLTKLIFERVVRSILRATTAESRLSRKMIHDSAIKMFPQHDSHKIVEQIDAALARLEKSVIRHHQQIDEFCLTHEESLAQISLQAKGELLESEFISAIRSKIKEEFAPVYMSIPEVELIKLVEATKNIFNSILIDRGFNFVNSIFSGQVDGISQFELMKIISKHMSGISIPRLRPRDFHPKMSSIVSSVLQDSGDGVRRYLRMLAESYLILFLMQETPDVQRTISSLFLSGNIWLDTNIVLPLLLESFDEPENRVYQGILKNAQTNKLNFYITSGVLEEVSKHFSKALACWHQLRRGWVGDVPFVYQKYLELGGQNDKFPGWCESIRGIERPEDDLLDYLETKFAIKSKNHEIDYSKIPPDVRVFVEEAWNRAHSRNRDFRPWLDAMTCRRLADHDIDNFLGILSRRSNERTGVSYENWWLTLDNKAFSIYRSIRGEFKDLYGVSPIMSVDFLINYLLLGPNRAATNRETLDILPHYIEINKNGSIPAQIIEISERVRSEYDGMEERLVRRKIRNAIDQFKQGLALSSRPLKVLGQPGAGLEV